VKNIIIESDTCGMWAKGIIVEKCDLNNKLPFPDNFFDVVFSNQVIEHLINIDCFIEEVYRILKSDGYAIISTENLSSWDNLLALFLGYQAFSQCISTKKHIGNKFSPQYKKDVEEIYFAHRTIFTYFGLLELFKTYGFIIEKVLTAGYSIFDKIDPIHSRYITVKVRKGDNNVSKK